MNVPGYQIERLIAEGGMASVYLAVQETLGRHVALKILRKFDNPADSERFLNEGRIIASLNHRNIITIYDVGISGERHYISMEYLEGGDLEQRIAKGMSVDEALRLVETIGGCLDFVNGKGIVHRDIKPANILFHKDGTPILTDFGIAKAMDAETSLTREGTAMGSPCYLSPEQAECKSLDGRADIYGLGVILFEMLAGRKPYERDSYLETVMAHLTEPIPLLPPELRRYQDLIDRMLAKERDERFATAGELLASVKELRRSERAAGPVAKAAGLVRGLARVGWVRRGTRPLAGAARTGIRKIRRLSPHNKRLGLGLVGALVVLFASAVLFLHWETPAEIETGITSEQTKLTTTAQTVENDPDEASEVAAAAAKTPESLNRVVPEGEPKPEAQLETPREETAPPASPGLVTADDEDVNIEAHLLSARDALDDYRLMTPKNDSAYYYYSEVLKRDPQHQEALQGMTEIAERYADLVEKELDQFDYSEAKKYLRRGLSVQPDNGRLLKLSEQTDILKDGPKRLVGKIKSLFD